MAQPNILYINSHDTGRLVQPYGYPMATPRLQRFAEEGVLFRQAFCAAPTCSPSRAALVTGSYPHDNGMLGLAHRGFSLRDYSQHIVSTLKSAGYSTALAGFQHVAADAAAIGYDTRLAPGASDGEDEKVSHAAVEFLLGRPREPFFLEVGFMDTHREFPEPPDDDVRYVRPPDYFADDERARYDLACFMKSARRLDGNIGIVLDSLEKSGRSGETLVICTTDHGAAFPRMKCNLTDGGIGVMLMMRGPGGFAGGKTIDALVSHVDIFPTLCELIGIEAPGWTRGVSLVPLVSGAAERVRDEVFAEVSYHAAYEPQRCVRTERWKYIRRFGERLRVTLPNCDDGATKTVWMERGWGSQRYLEEELYNLVFDPTEVNNVAADPPAKTVLEDMRGRLDRWMRETDDPLLRGPIPAPRGARVNDPDGTSPTEKPGIVP
jgi:N-sulfoglucosamine sulfohydrolase